MAADPSGLFQEPGANEWRRRSSVTNSAQSRSPWVHGRNFRTSPEPAIERRRYRRRLTVRARGGIFSRTLIAACVAGKPKWPMICLRLFRTSLRASLSGFETGGEKTHGEASRNATVGAEAASSSAPGSGPPARAGATAARRITPRPSVRSSECLPGRAHSSGFRLCPLMGALLMVEKEMLQEVAWIR